MKNPAARDQLAPAYLRASLTETLANHLADELDRPDRLADKVAERLGLTPEASQAPAPPRIDAALLRDPSRHNDPRAWREKVIEAAAHATGYPLQDGEIVSHQSGRLLLIERGQPLVNCSYAWEICSDGRLIDLQPEQRTG